MDGLEILESNESSEESGTKPFGGGIRFSYWKDSERLLQDMIFCEAKYASVKEELFENKIWNFDVEEYENCMHKVATANVKQFVAKTRRKWNEITQIKAGSDLGMEHLLCVIVFTESEMLKKESIKCCQKLHSSETMDQILQRHRELGHFFKHLLEIIVIFGEKSVNNEMFYFGTNEMYAFDEKKTRMTFAMPLSLSKLRTDARFNCGTDGILIDLRVLTPSFYFNAHLVSSTPHRNETVFFRSELWSIRRVWDIRYGTAIIDNTWKGKNVAYLQNSVLEKDTYLSRESHAFSAEWQALSQRLKRCLPVVSNIDVTDIGINDCTV